MRDLNNDNSINPDINNDVSSKVKNSIKRSKKYQSESDEESISKYSPVNKFNSTNWRGMANKKDAIIGKNMNDSLSQEIAMLQAQLNETRKENMKLKKDEVKRLQTELNKNQAENQGLKKSIDNIRKESQMYTNKNIQPQQYNTSFNKTNTNRSMSSPPQLDRRSAVDIDDDDASEMLDIVTDSDEDDNSRHSRLKEEHVNIQ